MNITTELDLWKQAVDQSLEACSFVDENNYFIYCNESWCRLLGYAESELKQMKWQDITISSDVGGDQAEVESVQTSKKDSYYLEKVYVRKNKTHINVGIYVHNYPKLCSNKGFIVFCRPLTGSSEYEELKRRFFDIEKTVTILHQASTIATGLQHKLDTQIQQTEENRELILRLMGKSDVKMSNRVGNDSKNDSSVIMYLVMGFGFLCTALISVGLVLAYIAYYNNGNEKMKPPEIQQIDFNSKE